VVPGNAVSPSFTWDAEKLRTRTFSVGDIPALEEGEEAPEEERHRPVVMVDNPQPLMPRLDQVDDWPSVILIETLTDRANTNAALYAGPKLSVSATVSETDPPLGSYDLGDDVQVLLRDRMHADGLSALGRLIGIDVDPASGTIGWTVNLTGAPAFGVPGPRLLVNLPQVRPRRRTTERIADLEGDVSTVFRRGAGLR
jgi:hypothetical protein